MRCRDTVALVVLFGAAACQTEGALREPDPDLNRMLEVPRLDPYEANAFMPQGMVMQAPPEGTRPYAPGGSGWPRKGTVGPGRYRTDFPGKLTRDLVLLGREGFERTCAACHGRLGTGDTPSARHMKRPPPSLHEPRIVEKPVGYLYEVIRDGYGLMPSYAAELSVRERWAVVAYVEALRRSQHAPLRELPEELAARVKEALE